METTIRKKKKTTDISLHLLKKKNRVTTYERRPISARWPDCGHIYVISMNFWGQRQTYLPGNILSSEEQGKKAVFAGFVKHAKEPPNANAREAPVK